MSEKAPKVIYTGHFVEDQDKLLNDIPPLIADEGAKVHAHHVTKEFRPKNGIESIEPGKRRTLMAIGYVAAEGVHAVLVMSPDGEQLTGNEFAHITIATAEGVAPVASNDVIAAATENGTIMPIEPPIPINVIEGYFDGKGVVTASPDNPETPN